MIALGCAPAAERSHLVMLTEGISPTLDPLAATDSRVDNLSINLYSALFQYTPGTTDLQMDLAASYRLSEDARRYVFDVREDALFHDGTPVLAEDVKYTVDRMLALKIGVWRYHTPVSGAEVLDERRVAIDLFEPFAGFLGSLTRLYILNADRVRPNEFQGDFGQGLQNHEAGSGPYLVAEPRGRERAISVGLVSARAANRRGALPRLPPGLGGAPCGSRTDLDEARQYLESAGIQPGEVELTMAFEGTTGETPMPTGST